MQHIFQGLFIGYIAKSWIITGLYASSSISYGFLCLIGYRNKYADRQRARNSGRWIIRVVSCHVVFARAGQTVIIALLPHFDSFRYQSQFHL